MWTFIFSSDSPLPFRFFHVLRELFCTASLKEVQAPALPKNNVRIHAQGNDLIIEGSLNVTRMWQTVVSCRMQEELICFEVQCLLTFSLSICMSLFQ